MVLALYYIILFATYFHIINLLLYYLLPYYHIICGEASAADLWTIWCHPFTAITLRSTLTLN